MGRNRGRHTVEERREIVESYRESGLSREDFCRERGLSVYALATWITRLSAKPVEKREANGGFVEARVKSRATESTGIEITFPSGAVLRVSV